MAKPTQLPHPDKAALRRQLLAARDALDESTRGKASLSIQEHVLTRTEFVNASGVHCFISLPGEVNTEGIFEACWDMGKSTYVPYQIRDEGRLGWAQRRRGDKLVAGSMNVLEPTPENRRQPPPRTIDLVLVPGVAFDRQGNRIGYGKGFYDEFLARIDENAVVSDKNNDSSWSKRVAIWGLAFSVQIVDAVPQDPWDKRMEAVLTEVGDITSPGRRL